MQSLRLLGAVSTIVLTLGFGANHARAAGVAAGTTINNTATVDYSVGSVTATATSNTVSVVVAEILNVDVQVQTPSVGVAPGATQQILRYLVTNTGNGPETFRLVMNNAIGSDQFDPIAASPAIYLDTDSSGALNAGDLPYVVGSNDPALPADGSVTVFVVNDIPAGVVDGNIGLSTLTADARTGVGPAGTVYANQGFNNTDAVVGTSGAADVAQGQYLVTGVNVTAAKSQIVADQFGGARALPGARINYTVLVDATGTGTATGALFTDNIPAGTTYVAGTLRLNSTALSDAADVDTGTFEAAPVARVRVQLGDLTVASGTQTIQFAVTINN